MSADSTTTLRRVPPLWGLVVLAALVVLASERGPGWGFALLLALGCAATAVLRAPRIAPLRWSFALLALVLAVYGLRLADWTADRVGDTVAGRFDDTTVALRAQAQEAAASLTVNAGMDPAEPSTREPLFRQLEEALERSGGPGDSLFLVDSDGVAVAWAGTGLRHALPDLDLPEEGVFGLQSFTANTLGSVAAVPGPGPWRLVAGRSDSALELPPWLLHPLTGLRSPTDASLPEREWGWGRADGRTPAAPGVLRAEAGGLVLEVRDSALDRLAGRHRHLPLLVLPLLLILLLDALLGTLALVKQEGLDLAPATLVFLAVVGLSLRAELFDVLQVGGALILLLTAVVCRALGSRLVIRGLAMATIPSLVVATAVGFALLGAAAARGDHRWVRLGSEIQAGGGVLLAVLATAILLHAARGTVPSPPAITRSLLLAGGGLLVISHWVPSPEPALALVLLAVAMLGAPGLPGGVAARLVEAILATAAAAVLWVTLVTVVESRQVVELVDPNTSSFSLGGRQALRQGLSDHFRDTDLQRLTLGLDPLDSRANDLPLLLWATSPLVDTPGPSAVHVVGGDGGGFFGFGLELDSVTGEFVLDDPPGSLDFRSWVREASVRDVVELRSGDDGGPVVEFVAFPFPSGAPSAGAREISLARRFLLGEGGDHPPPLVGTTLVVGPWEGDAAVILGPPPLESAPRRARGPSTIDPPDRDASGRGRTDGGEVIEQWFEDSFSLVRLAPQEVSGFGRLLRSAVLASGMLLLGGAVMALLLVSWLARPGTRPTEILGPFSRRLVLVFAIFTSVPIVLLSALLLQVFSDRLLAEQRADGEAALDSAERMVGDYLSSLEPGFSVSQALDDELLDWISSIVRHEITLYWRGSVLTSSRPELFTAGLLGSQIPGEVYADLELEGRSVAARVNQSIPGTRYLELYRRVELPGAGRGFGLFVSVPLLAQEAATTEVLSSLANRAMALAVWSTILLVFVAVRFARAFTQPITAIVHGTERIAGGRTSLGFRPRIPELRHLAESIDEMAARIASGREQLLREKRVVDTVVANINSAVISFGEGERVIMANREAADLLGVRPGDSLEELVGRVESPELAAIVRRRPQVAERSSVRLGESGEEDAREWTVQWLPIEGEGDPSALLVLEDVTEVLRAQRLEAWAEMARIIAHEVKNPLTPIRLSAEHLRRVYEQSPEQLDEVFHRCIDNILAQVEELRLIAGEFSIYSRIPEADRRSEDLVVTLRDFVDSYRTGRPESLEFPVDLPSGPVRVEHDRRLVTRVLRNLYENAIRACDGRGAVALSLEVLHDAKGAPQACIRVRDSGPGVPQKDLHRIFEPSFSASSGGTGLGLPIARGIIEEHGGQISARNLRDPVRIDGLTLGGLEVSILLPAVTSESDQQARERA